MRQYEIRFASYNNELYPKWITALVIEPERTGPRTGAMLFSHGWGGNRFLLRDRMEYTCEKFDLVCVGVEYRQSGYDFDAVTGLGAFSPYDASFLQTLDVLNGLRTVLASRPGLDRGRLFHYGQSQGGHIALLSAIYAPNTFAFVYGSSPLTFLGEDQFRWSGRDFSAWELSARNVQEHAERIRCPVVLEHGTADPFLPWKLHSGALAERLRKLGKKVTLKLYEGGDHAFQPTITKFEAFKKLAPGPMRKLRNRAKDDFLAGSVIEIPCAGTAVRIDWSKPAGSGEMVRRQ